MTPLMASLAQIISLIPTINNNYGDCLHHPFEILEAMPCNYLKDLGNRNSRMISLQILINAPYGM